jgi:LysR family glycine cleavage system transcriptional activator
MHRQRALPPLNSLAAFEAAARLASFSKAAGELHVTPAAVSRHIKIMEGWLGRPLFDRRHRGVALTTAGEAYLSECGAALDRIAEATARQVEQGRGRVLRVNALATFTMRWLIPRLPSFQVANPGVEVRLSTSRDPIASLRGDFDVVIRGGPEDVPGYVATEFLKEHRVPVCGKALLKKLPLRTAADLRHHTLLHAAALPGVWTEWLEAAGVPGLMPKASLTLDHFYLTLQAAVDGLGVAIGPVALVADDVAEGRLVKPFAGPTLPEWRYFAYLRRSRGDATAAIRFRDWLLTVERRADVATSHRRR